MSTGLTVRTITGVVLRYEDAHTVQYDAAQRTWKLYRGKDSAGKVTGWVATFYESAVMCVETEDPVITQQQEIFE